MVPHPYGKLLAPSPNTGLILTTCLEQALQFILNCCSCIGQKKFCNIDLRFSVQASVAHINSHTMQSADIAIAEQELKQLSKEFSPCKVYEKAGKEKIDGFVSCAREMFQNYYTSSLECTLPGTIHHNTLFS